MSDFLIFLCGYTGVDVPVVGGHAGVTILPLFSQVIAHVQALNYIGK